MAISTTKPPPTESATIQKHLQLFNLVMYILIFVVSVTANIFMILVLRRKFRRHRKTAKSFIILMNNLGISGLVLVITSIPFDLVDQSISDEWPFGAGGCKILWPLQTAAVQAMVYSYVALAYHRFHGLTRGLFGQMKFITAVLMTFFIWIISFVTVIPYVLNLDYNYENKTCEENWDSEGAQKGYSVALFLLDYLLPLIVALILYLLVWGKLQRFKVLDPERVGRRDRHQRILRMLVAYIVVFAILLLPYHIMWFIKDFDDGEEKLYFQDTLNVIHVFTYSVTVFNPIIFFLYNPEFKRHLRYLIQCQCITKKEIFSLENLSESFSEESDPPPRLRAKPKAKPLYDYKYDTKSVENNYASTPTMSRAEFDTMPPENSSGLGLVEASLFPAAAGRLRGQEKQRGSSPSASPPPSELMYDNTDARSAGSFDQGSEML